jgi:hypothetical protein
MSYLNALASSGLTVGLRFYAADHSQRVNRREDAAAADDLAPFAPAAQAEAMGSAEAGRASRPAPPVLSPEERAAGRAEVKAQLAAEGTVGRLQSDFASPVAAQSGEAEEEDEAGEETAGAADDSGQAEGPLKKLTPEEEAEVRKLAQRDQEVKAHEQAHVAASGGLAGSPKYEYQTGPDGQKYAVGGEVSISRSGSSDTDKALSEAEAVKRGALAPAQPSSQDLAVAAGAEADIRQLQAKQAKEEQAETEGQGSAPQGSAPNEQAGLKTSLVAPEKVPANGADLGSQVAGAYAAVKLGFQSAVRPLLARA